MNIREFAGLPPELNTLLRENHALIEVVELRANGQAQRTLRPVYGSLDLNILTDREKAALLAHDGGLYGAPEPVEQVEEAKPMTRDAFERLTPGERMEHVRSKLPIVD